MIDERRGIKIGKNANVVYGWPLIDTWGWDRKSGCESGTPAEPPEKEELACSDNFSLWPKYFR